MIAMWHGFLDYDRNIPQWKKDAIRLDREAKKSARLKLDAKRIYKTEENAREARKQADLDQKARRAQRESYNRSFELPQNTGEVHTPPSRPSQYMLFVGAEQKGPYVLSQLQTMWRAGLITADTLYCKNESEERKPITAIADLLNLPSESYFPSPRQPSPRVVYTQAPPQKSGCTLILLIGLGIVAGVIMLSLF
jgi:hypothetical protein